MTVPKIGSIIKYPYWEPDSLWVVLEHREDYPADREMYITASLVGGGLKKETLSAYTGEEKLEPWQYNSAAYWEYVT